MICRKSAPCLSVLPVFLTMSELFYSDMVHFSGSHGALKEKGACGEKPRVLVAALRALDLQVCPHTTLLPHKKTGAHLREHRSDLHVIWSSDLRALHPRPRSHPRLHACRASPHPLPALTRSARRRPWRHVQRTAAPARERSRQRPEPHGRCARPRQDGFRRRSEALQ